MADQRPLTGSESSEPGIYTDTLARLYLKQGFVERALMIYRHLAQAQPDNASLREQVAVLERQLAAAPGSTGECLSPIVPRATAPKVPVPVQGHIRQLLQQLERWLRYLQQH